MINGASEYIYIAGVEAQKWYRDGSPTRRLAPDVKLILQPAMLPWIPVELVGARLGDLIKSYSYEKDRHTSHGTFSVTIAGDDEKIISKLKLHQEPALKRIWNALGADKSAQDIFKPPSLGQLWVNGYLIMTGELTAMRKDSSGGEMKTYTLSFNELGHRYNNTIPSIKLNEIGKQMNFLNNGDTFMSAVASSYGNVPAHLAIVSLAYATLFDTVGIGSRFLAPGIPQPMITSDGIPLLARMIAAPAPLGGISTQTILSTLPYTLSQYLKEGVSRTTFWDWLKGLAPEPFIELFCESGGRVRCTGRTIPSTTGAGSVLQNILSTPGTAAGSAILGLPAPVPGLFSVPMIPGFNYMIMRSMPYDNPLLGFSAWHVAAGTYMLGVFDLLLAGDYGIITDDDVMSYSLGVSDAQQYTAFEAQFGNDALMSVNWRPSYSMGPILPNYPGGRKSFGTKLATYDLNPVSLPKYTANASVEKFQKIANASIYSTILNAWFRNAVKFREGTVTLRNGMPWLRPGDAIIYTTRRGVRNGVEDQRNLCIYYIDSVSASGSVGGQSTCTLNLIRGVPMPTTYSALANLLLDWDLGLIPPNTSPFNNQ